MSPRTGNPEHLPEALLNSVRKLRLTACEADTAPKEACISRDVAGKAWAFHQKKPEVLHYNTFYKFKDLSQTQSVLNDRVPEWARQFVVVRSYVDESGTKVHVYSLVRNCPDSQLLDDPSTFVSALRRMISTKSSCSCGISR